MKRFKRAIPIALFFVLFSASITFGASNKILTSSSTSGSPGVTYNVYTDVQRTGEKTAYVDYTISATPNGSDSCIKKFYHSLKKSVITMADFLSLAFSSR